MDTAAADHVRINPEGWARPHQAPACDHGVQVGPVASLLTVAAQGSLDERGRLLHEGDLAAQLALSVTNFERVLVVAGMGWPDVVQLRVYTTDLDGFAGVQDLLAERLGPRVALPPTTVAEVRRLPLAGMAVALDGLAARTTPAAGPTGP